MAPHESDFDRGRIYADVFEQMGDAVVVTRLDGTITGWNRGAERMFGYSRDEALGQTPALIIGGPPPGTDRVREILEHLFKDGHWYQEYTFRHKNGSRGQAEAYFVVVRDPSGAPYLTVGVNRDITTRKEAEAERRFAAELLDQSAGSTHAIRNSDLTFVYVNARFEQLFGYRAEEILGQPISRIIAGTTEGPEATAQRIHQTLLRDGGWSGEVLNRRRDGTTFWSHARVTGYEHHQHGAVWLGMHEDITALKRADEHRRTLEQQLGRAQRLEALGTLASGVAHDFNNILQGLCLTVEALQEEIPADSPIRSEIDRGFEFVDRGRTVVARILDYAHDPTPTTATTDLVELVERTVELLDAPFTSTITLETRVPRGTLLCAGDVRQLEQVLVNLCTNARDAMRRDGGTLRILVGPEGTDSVRLTVEDTGEGIAPEDRERIYDPFFTTKPIGRGTGLGLSVVHRIIEGLDGSISVESEPGRGTRFDILLPRAKETPATPKAERSPTASKHLRVMLVDDEESLLRTYRTVLERRDYATATFANPRDALSALRSDPEVCDVLITDQTMPQMTGLQLAREVEALRADLPVILITGRGVLDLELPKSVRRVLGKPFRMKELVRVVEAALAGPAPGSDEKTTPV